MAQPADGWTQIAGAVLAGLALIVSAVSLRISAKAYGLSKSQDERRSPRLVANIGERCFVRTPNGGRAYDFHLSVSNPSDTDNAVARVTLVITYRTRGVTMNMKLPALQLRDPQDVGKPALVTPFSLAAHGTTSGWCHFFVAAEVLDGVLIDGHELVLTDSHQATTRAEAILVNELRHED